MAHFPKEPTSVLYRRGASLAQITVEARLMPAPGILVKTASIITELGMRILSLTFTARGGRRYVTAFVDLTESEYGLGDLVERLRREEFVVRIESSEAEFPGLLVDRHCFPLEAMGGEIRALLVPAETFSEIFAVMRERYGASAWVLAFHLGRLLGESIARRLMELVEAPPEDMARLFAQVYTAYGWGKMEVRPLFLGRGIRVAVEENFEALAYGRSLEPVCHFTRGVIAGAASAVLGRECSVEEVKCRAMGDERCEFVVREGR